MSSLADRNRVLGTIGIAPRRGLTLVVPLYNERERFLNTADDLADWIASWPSGGELVFVDDGSTDGTPDLIESFLRNMPGTHARLIRRPHEGKGAAVQAGLQSAQGDYAAFCDIDLSTPLPDLERVISAVGREKVAIGSRALPESDIARHQSRVREWLGRLFNRLVQALLTPGIVDTQCGAKAAHVDVWNRILRHCTEPGFSWDVEVLVVAGRLGIEIDQVPVRWAHEDRSKVHVLRDGLNMVAALLTIRRRARAATRDVVVAPVPARKLRPVPLRKGA